MTTTLLNVHPIAEIEAAPASLRCDACGDRVTDPDAHLRVCIEYELALFAVGRRAG